MVLFLAILAILFMCVYLITGGLWLSNVDILNPESLFGEEIKPLKVTYFFIAVIFLSITWPIPYLIHRLKNDKNEPSRDK